MSTIIITFSLQAYLFFEGSQSDPDPLDFIQGDLVPGMIVELGCHRALVRSDRLSILNGPSIFQVSSNASCPQGVAGGGRGKSGLAGSPFNHAQNVSPRQRRLGGSAAAIDRPK